MGLFSVAASEVIRPAAILNERTAADVLAWMEHNSVVAGGHWLPTASLWQRYDAPWDGVDDRGAARLIGSIAVVYGQPGRHEITIYKVSITQRGVDDSWDVERLCDEALACVGLSLATVPRAQLYPPPARDPFHVPLPGRPDGAATVG